MLSERCLLRGILLHWRGMASAVSGHTKDGHPVKSHRLSCGNKSSGILIRLEQSQAHTTCNRGQARVNFVGKLTRLLQCLISSTPRYGRAISQSPPFHRLERALHFIKIKSSRRGNRANVVGRDTKRVHFSKFNSTRPLHWPKELGNVSRALASRKTSRERFVKLPILSGKASRDLHLSRTISRRDVPRLQGKWVRSLFWYPDVDVIVNRSSLSISRKKVSR